MLEGIEPQEVSKNHNFTLPFLITFFYYNLYMLNGCPLYNSKPSQEV